MTIRRRWTLIAAALFAFGLGICWIFGSLSMRPASSVVSPAVTPARDLTIASSDGVILAATYWPGSRADSPAVLLLHGNGASRGQFAQEGAMLARQGYAVLAIDFRGHGESTPRNRTFGWTEADDAHAAFTWLKRQQHGAKVAVVGISLGGAAALIGPRGPLPADALVLQAVYPDIRRAIGNRIAALSFRPLAWLVEPLLSYQAPLRFGAWPADISPVRSVARYHGPLRVVGGEDDVYTPPAETLALYEAAPGPKRLWIAPGLDHAGISAAGTPAYRALLIGFLEATLGKTAPGGSPLSARSTPA